MDSKYCKDCRNKVINTIKICPKCGSKFFDIDTMQESTDQTTPNIDNRSAINSTVSPNTSSQINSSTTPTFVNNFISIGGGILAMALFFVIGGIQIYAGFLGIEHEFGYGWAIASLVLAFFLRITFPLTIGTFLCALNIWHWNWFGALLFTAPGLLFIIPGMLGGIIYSFKK